MPPKSDPPETAPSPSEIPDPLAELTRRLGYLFSDRELLQEALTHRSYHNERPTLAPRHNERLEFLGDSIIGTVVTTVLYESFPNAREGSLTRKRAALVCEAGLTSIALELSLGPALLLGRGEEKSGGREKPRLLSSGVEALVGAVYLDGGYDAAHVLVRRLIGPRITDGLGKRDDKSRIQEWAQRERGVTPRYEVVRSEGPDHEREFSVAIFLGDENWAEGRGRSKTEAEQAAAQAAIARRDRAAAEAAAQAELDAANAAPEAS